MLRVSALFFAVLLGMTACSGGGGGGAGSAPTAAAPPAPTMSETEAARFLLRATFGPTEESIDNLVILGYESWLDEQFAIPTTLQLAKLTATLEAANLEANQGYAKRLRRVDTWWDVVVNGEDQLRQRVAFALSQIFVISDEEAALQNTVLGVANYNDLLAEHAFGNYRELLHAVTLNPMMGDFLSMRRNEKADPENNISPDENYAREVMQLFSIGLWELNLDGTRKLDEDEQPIPTFTYYEILEFARVYTGWNYGNAPRLRFSRRNAESEVIPMTSFEDFHDRDLKYLLGYELVPAGLDAPEDLDAALDNIFNHSNVAPFISTQLIQHLVTSNPSPDYVERIATIFEDNGSGERGDLKRVVQEILLDEEALAAEGFTFGKLKDPLLKVTQLWRAFEAEGEFGVLRFGDSDNILGQRPLGAPSVFNFFRPDYQHPGELQNMGLNSPAFELLTESTITTSTNILADFVYGARTRIGDNAVRHPVLLDFADELALADDPEGLVDHLDILLMGGLMSDEMKTALTENITENELEDDGTRRVQDAVFLIVSSPEFSVQR